MKNRDYKLLLLTVKNNDAAERRFIEQQHRFRGLLAAYKSRRFVEDRRALPAQRFRSSLSNLLLDVRASLDPTQYRPFLEWIAQTIDIQLSELLRSPIRYDDLVGIYPRARVMPLEIELLWIAERARIAKDRINSFLAARAIVERATVSGKYDEVIEGVQLIQQAFGVSLWSVQLRLSLEHQAGGLERQKQYSAEVRGVFKRGILGFVTYYSSVRNEDRTTFSRFLDDIENRIANHRYYNEETRKYMRYRLKNECPVENDGLADILRVEQNHGIIDIYETYVAILQEIVRSVPSKGLAEVILRCIESSEIDDFRLAKIARLLEPSADYKLPMRDTSASDALFDGHAVKAARASRHVMRGHAPIDPWQAIYAGFAFGHENGARTRGTLRSAPTTIAQMLGRVQSRCEIAAELWGQTAKIAINFRGLPVFAGIFDFLIHIRRATPDAPWRPWFVGLNSPTIGIEDHCWDRPLSVAPGKPGNLTFGIWSEALAADYPDRSPASLLLRSAGHIHRGEFEEAISTLGLRDDRWPEQLNAIRALLLLHAHHSRGERQHVISLIASEGARGSAHRQLLPIVGTLQNYKWSDYKKVPTPLAAAIALHILWTAQENSLTASQLRFATGETLRREGITRPSKLSESAHNYPPHELIYFLRWICVPEILDVSRFFRGTRETMDERLAICGVLEELDPLRASLYQEEVINISNLLAMDEGQWIVDSTRIHVNSDALIRWAHRELSEDFNRFNDLSPVLVHGIQSFEDA